MSKIYIPLSGDRALVRVGLTSPIILTYAGGFFGTKGEAEHSGAVGTDASLMAYVKQMVTLCRAIVAGGGNSDIIPLVNALYGEWGITTWLAGAKAGDGVSMSEVLRYVQELLDSALIDGLAAFPAGLQAGAGVSLPEVARWTQELLDVVAGALYGVAGVASYPSGAAAANSVSIAEVLRYTQEAVKKSGGGALAAGKSLVDAIGSDGSLLSYGAGSVLGAVGTTVCHLTVVLGHVIPDDEQTLSVGTAIGGAMLVDDVIVQVGPSGTTPNGWDDSLNPTNFAFTTNNYSGLTKADDPVIKESRGTFKANKTFVASRDGNVKKLPFVLESGKSLFLHGDDGATGANAAGNVYVIGRRLAAGASIGVAS